VGEMFFPSSHSRGIARDASTAAAKESEGPRGKDFTRGHLGKRGPLGARVKFAPESSGLVKNHTGTRGDGSGQKHEKHAKDEIARGTGDRSVLSPAMPNRRLTDRLPSSPALRASRAVSAPSPLSPLPGIPLASTLRSLFRCH
jgi:hypothetical protein